MAANVQKELENLNTQVTEVDTLTGRVAAAADNASDVRAFATDLKTAAAKMRTSVDALKKELAPPEPRQPEATRATRQPGQPAAPGPGGPAPSGKAGE